MLGQNGICEKPLKDDWNMLSTYLLCNFTIIIL